MRKIIILLLSIISLSSCNHYQYDFYSTIEGVVVDGESSPIEGARVTLSPGGLNTLTDQNGGFIFSELEQTKYTVTAQKTGYSTDRKEVSTYAGESIKVTLILNITNN